MESVARERCDHISSSTAVRFGLLWERNGVGECLELVTGIKGTGQLSVADLCGSPLLRKIRAESIIEV